MNFINHPVFSIIWFLFTIISVFWILRAVISWIFNLTPIVYRLGMALWKRNVAIFWSSEAFINLRDLLTDSSIFKKSKIEQINKYNIEKASEFSIYLVDWESYQQYIDEVFSIRKNHQVWIVIYAKPWSIPPDKMEKIVNHTNTSVVNARWRLLNDIFTLLITTKYGS